MRGAVLCHSQHGVSSFREEHTYFQSVWYSSDWKQNIHKLLIIVMLEVNLKSIKNASLLAWLGNLGKETEMCVLRELSCW